MMKLLTLILLCALLPAQDAPPTSNAPVPNAAVSGIVRDKNTGKPVPGYTVSTYVGATWIANTIIMPSGSKSVTSTTDESGRYRLADLPAAPYRIQVRNSHGGASEVTKSIVMNGHDLNDLNFDILVEGTIKGRVLDENKEPVPGITVSLVSRQYFLGVPGYFFAFGGGRTNDRGEYAIQNVPAGQPYFLMAERVMQKLPTHSETPLSPKLRRRIPMRTWYPNSPSKDGAAPVVLRSTELREGVEIEMKKSAAFCAEGTLLTGSGGPGALNFRVEALQPSSGINQSGGSFRSSGFGMTGSDGAFRVCDLNPGSYRIEASQTKPDLLFGVSTINIDDQDVKNLKIAALPVQPVEGEAVLDGPVPLTPLTTKVTVNLQPLLRTQFPGERAGAGRVDIPGTFTLPGVTPDDYVVRTFINGPGLYVKDVQWAGISVLYQAIHPGSSTGSGLRVVIGQDGATLAAVVADKDSNPVPDIRVVAFPAEIASEGMLAAAMVTGQTDQTGQYTSQPLAPGKYFVGAVDGSVDYTPEVIARLWRSRNRFKDVDLSPNGNAQVTLMPVTLAQ